MELDSFLQIIYKPLGSIAIIDKQIDLLSQNAPNIVNINEKLLDVKSGTNYILSAILTDFVPKLDFMHKKQKANPPQISNSFFRGKLLRIRDFETKNIA